ANLMGTEKMINEAATDKYSFIKNAYQQRRDYLVHDGNVPAEDDIDLMDEDESSTGSTSAPKNSAPSKNAPASKLPLSSPAKTGGLPPVINNSRHFLELSAPK
ncbi:MAG: VacJ family lipoprotein, partial [Methylococcaceae bacterium]